jgi:deoxyhypusine synthase
MPLPKVAAWLIDHRTAAAIFESGNNVRIDHCLQLCEEGRLLFCHTEAKLFRSSPRLKQVFVDDHDCLCSPDKEMMDKCVSVWKNPKCAKLMRGHDVPIFMTAAACCKDYGIISDHRSILYTTAYDLAAHFGISVFSADEYFEHIP